MNHIKNLLLAILLFFTFSCLQNKDKKKQIEKINHFIQSTDSLKNQIEAIDIKNILEYTNELSDIKKDIITYYKADFVDENISRKINRLNGVRKQFLKFNVLKNKLYKKIDTFTMQLTNLKYDISNDAGEIQRYNEYLNFENENYRKIKQEQEFLYNSIAYSLKDYHELKPFIYNFIDSIKHND